LHFPLTQGPDGSLVCRTATGSDKSGPEELLAPAASLVMQERQSAEYLRERSLRQRTVGVTSFMPQKWFEPFRLVNVLRFGGKQHRVAGERKPYFVR
jgi:hypothetical protein